MERKAYPSDVSDEEWAFVAPYLTLMTEDASQRVLALREVFNGLRYIVRIGMLWRMMPNDLPPWHTVYQQTQRWLRASVFEAMVHDLRMLLREIAGRPPQPRAAVLDARTLQSTPESGARAGYDGHKRRKGSKVHLAVDTLGPIPKAVSSGWPKGSSALIHRNPDTTLVTRLDIDLCSVLACLQHPSSAASLLRSPCRRLVDISSGSKPVLMVC